MNTERDTELKGIQKHLLSYLQLVLSHSFLFRILVYSSEAHCHTYLGRHTKEKCHSVQIVEHAFENFMA